MSLLEQVLKEVEPEEDPKASPDGPKEENGDTA